MNKPVSVILPTLNERENIVDLITAIQNNFSPAEILVIDDHSPDGTGIEVNKLAKHQKNVRCVVNKSVVGLTKSLQKGIALSRSKYIVWMDADFSHPPDLLPIMYNTMLSNKADVVVASWLTIGGKDERKEKTTVFFSYSINIFCQLCFGSNVHTYTSGYILAKRSLLEEIPLRGDYGEYCIDFLVRCLRAKKTIVEVPFVCESRLYGVSKTATNIVGYCVKGRYYILTILRLLFWKYNAHAV